MENELLHHMMLLVFQLAMIIFAAHFGGLLMRPLGMPSVLGEVLAGVIIGPHLLGGLAFGPFAEGLFPKVATSVGVSPELYGFAVLASIILLFVSGLETDLNLFVRYAGKGTIVGLGGIVVPFALGGLVTSLFLGVPFMDPRALFMGVVGVATSVGITARILSENRRVDSPEGVTILSAAVIDDVVGIIVLAIVLGIVRVASGDEGGIPWAEIGLISVKALAVWLGFTVVGLIAARSVSSFLKLFKSRSTYTTLSLGLAMVIAGIFENAGLAMIVGAFVTGLSLSKTDLSYVIQENIKPLRKLFVPIFFAVMGMMVDVRVLLSPTVLLFGLVYALAATLGKVVGTGLPALALNFNRLGALRIGLGMVPRGEVALIIAGIGVSAGVLDSQLLGVVIMMTLLTIILSPPLLGAALRKLAKGTRREERGTNTVTTTFDFPTPELTEFVIGKVVRAFESEGFFINLIEVEERIYQIRKDEVSLSLTCRERAIDFQSEESDTTLVKTIVYESLLELHESVDKLKALAKPESLGKELLEGGARKQAQFLRVIDPQMISTDLKGRGKREVIEELLDMIAARGALADRDACLEAIMERERSMSTGMQHGIAIPHGKSVGTTSMHVAVAISKEGIDFAALDGEPSRIFILVVSPVGQAGPHIQFLASITGLLREAAAREAILAAKSPQEVAAILQKG